MGKGDTVAVLDIGTSKVLALVGEVSHEGVHVVGVGVHPAKGIRDGVIVNIEEASNSIQRAVEDAELMADTEINNVYVGISGSHIECEVVRGEVTLKSGVVQRRDIKEAIDMATMITVHNDRECIGIHPVEFVIDGNRGIKEPLGMSGRKLEVKIMVITALKTHMEDLASTCRRAGLRVVRTHLNSIASAEAVLTPDEKELGACVVDIGGGTTNVAVFHGGMVQEAFEIPLGGRHVTRDLAAGLHTTLQEAERVKKSFGSALPSTTRKDEEVEVKVLYVDENNRKVTRRRIAEIIEPRVEEILEFVDFRLAEREMKEKMGAGIVLTGGTALLPGIVELARSMFEMPVRIGKPMGVSGLVEKVSSPTHASAVGLLLTAARELTPDEGGIMRRRKSMGGFFSRIRDVFETWF